MRSLTEAVRRKLTKRVAFPLLNRLIADTGERLYHYSADMDRLFAISSFDWQTYRFLRSGSLDSDGWWQAVRDLDLRGGVILDVGANTGYTAAWFSTIADRVYAFEPDPTNIEALQEQVRIRGLTNVEIRTFAIGDLVGRVDLRRKERSGHHALSDVGASETLGRTQVHCTTLDGFLADEGLAEIRLLKIDVEGFETEVLRGAQGSLTTGGVQRILFEYSPEFYRRRGIDDSAPVSLLSDLGFSLFFTNRDPFVMGDPRAREQCDLLAFAAGIQAWTD